MSDHRKEERKSLKAFTPVFALNPRTRLGSVEDLTVLGAMIIGEKPVEINKHMTLSIEFSGNVPELTTPRIVIPARVAWCKQDKNPDYFFRGFEFTEIKPKDEKAIEAILRRYKFHREIPAANAE